MRSSDPVALAAVIMIFLIPLTAIIAGYFVRRLQTQERLRAIEKGVDIPGVTR